MLDMGSKLVSSRFWVVVVLLGGVGLAACSPQASRRGMSPVRTQSVSDSGASVVAPPARYDFGIDDAKPVGRPIAALGDSSVLYFPFDIPAAGSGSYALDSADKDKVARVAEYLKDHPGEEVQIEGHSDPRGTDEYNLALGARRAQFFKDQIVAQGVDESRISIVSYGNHRPACSCHGAPGCDAERCFAQDRRAVVVVKSAHHSWF